MRSIVSAWLQLAVLLSGAWLFSPAHGNDDVVDLGEIVVIGSTPLSGSEIDLRSYPGNAQVFGAQQLLDAQSLNVGEYLGRRATSVHLSDAANNPFQTDLFFRGYSVSPLLGLPQGLAVYQDGVRVNEPFGDTVNWDLLPDSAIARIDLIPGSNATFGQNALGGALSVRTKTGWDAPGAMVEASGGSFGRHGVTASYGNGGEHLAFFATAETTDEDGWREQSDSELRRLFARGSWKNAGSTADLILSAADNRLRGNGAVPIELLEAEGRDAVFTHPDQTRPQLLFVNLLGSHAFGPKSRLDAGLYVRQNRIATFNGDGTEFEACEDPQNVSETGEPFLCEEEDDGEEVIEDLDGEPVVAGAENDSATRNGSHTRIDGLGTSLQWSWAGEALGLRNRLHVGVSYDQGRSRFSSDTELARLTDDRGTVGSGIFVGEARVRLRAKNSTTSLYVSDLLNVSERFAVTAGGRLDRTRIRLIDLGEEGDLDGNHRFTRFNPILGATYQLTPALTLFGSAAQSSRTPTPVELTCANPDDPCRLPNGFVDDPPLDQVVTRTLELGLRGRQQALRWSAALFHAVSADDILFITDGRLANQGYFDNVGDTRRRGAELSGDWRITSALTLSLSYSFLDATFREHFLVNTPNHPLRDEFGEVAAAARTVTPGDRIPLIPRHLAKAVMDWQSRRFGAGLELIGRSAAIYRGDEANADRARIDGFVVANAYGSWQLWPALSLFLRVHNLFDTEYETFGVFGASDQVLGEDFEDARRFVGPGAPRAMHGGLRWRF